MTTKKLINETEFMAIDFVTLTPRGGTPEPIEIGLQKINNGQVNARAAANWLIKPPTGYRVTKTCTDKTGITQSDLKNKQNLDTILTRVDITCKKKEIVFIAQDAQNEVNIFERHIDKFEGITKTPIVDTALLAKHILPNLTDYKLETIAQALELPVPDELHRALYDCKLAGEVFVKLLAKDTKLKTVDGLLKIAGVKTSYSKSK